MVGSGTKNERVDNGIEDVNFVQHRGRLQIIASRMVITSINDANLVWHRGCFDK
jgi:hypothetical protein